MRLIDLCRTIFVCLFASPFSHGPVDRGYRSTEKPLPANLSHNSGTNGDGHAGQRLPSLPVAELQELHQEVASLQVHFRPCR